MILEGLQMIDARYQMPDIRLETIDLRLLMQRILFNIPLIVWYTL